MADASADATVLLQFTATVNGEKFTAGDVRADLVQQLFSAMQADMVRYAQAALQAAFAGMTPDQLSASFQATAAKMDAEKLWPIFDRNGYLVGTGDRVTAVQNAFALWLSRDGVTQLMPPIPAPDGSTPAQLGQPTSGAPAATTTPATTPTVGTTPAT